MPEEIINPGLAEDNRSQIDKEKDYIHEEIAPQAVPLKWNRDMSKAPIYSTRFQDGSGSCVGQAIAKALETVTGIVQSAHPVYRRRARYPLAGMYLQDGGDIVNHLGTTTEVLDPSQNMNEEQMNKDIFVETPLKKLLYISANFTDIDTIATAIEMNKHCVLTVKGNINQEYAPFEKPIVVPNSTVNFGHAVCGTYYFTDEKGEKCILIDESWGDNFTRRILTESYIKARCTGALYFLPLVPTPTPKPHFTFFTPMSYGQTSLSIKNLQDVLKFEGYFPTSVASSGNYLELTRKGVLQWQLEHAVAPLDELNALQGRRAGQKTITALNALYSV